MAETGSKRRGISVDTKHLFPMIMQWPYAEKDIFLHKQVSNATDAVTKLPAMTADEANAGGTAHKMARPIYMLAMLVQRQLHADEWQSCLDDSFDLLVSL